MDERETGVIAAFLNTSVETFLKIHCEARNGKRYVKSGADGYCVFFNKDRGCLIHQVKPAPCRLWPFYPALLKDPESWREAMNACPGINPDASHEDFLKEAGE